MIKLNIERNNKDFQILENQEVLIRGIKPKWYSSQINFFYNSRTYQIKKKSFWSSSFNIFQGSKIVGVFNYKWKTGGYSLSLNDSKKSYTLSQSNTGGMWRIEKLYTLLEDGIKPVLSIKYSYKKWKENLEIHKIDLSDSSLDLIMYGLFLMRRLQSAESAVSGISAYG
tara:strand:+ start:66 stop:572 length:507 start_codon:yes stop_codon:yes gene_type:complete